MIADANPGQPRQFSVIEIDVISALFVLTLIGVGVMAIVKRRGEREHAPGGSEVYKLARRMAHALEGVLILDDNLPNLPNTQRSSIEALLKEWEKKL